jgi:hypothetical protein
MVESRHLDVIKAFDYTIEIRWQKTVSVRMETTLADSELAESHRLSICKCDDRVVNSSRGDMEKRSLQLYTHDNSLSARERHIRKILRRST